MTTIESAIGRVEEREDVVGPVTLRGFAALLDVAAGEVALETGLPPLWHWGLFQDWVRPDSLGEDGHPRRGGFLPAVAGLDSRMFAGGRLDFHRRLQLGEVVTRRSMIQQVKETEGTAGRLVIVTVAHTIGGAAGPAITEEQDLVFRAAVPLPAKPPEPAAAEAPAAAWRRQVTPDSVTLFRMSALTGNGHRIHYDQPYATGVEGYPALVVHGPLQAIWMADLLRRHMPAGLRLGRFAFRGRRPAFADRPLTVEGWTETDTVQLRTRDESGGVCMTATAWLVQERS
jgi:hydroxyacyl-ACP dehydratase HTD2-like protein with hotdog domain